jgi:hypothetical protein
VDWLIECQQSYCYTHETLYISIRLFDMYMSKKPSTPVTEVQLVAGTALFVASKFEVSFCEPFFLTFRLRNTMQLV